MVVYDLICKGNHRFEGWFPNFEGYQQQAAEGLISCPSCGTTKVEKLPHACAVHVKKDAGKPAADKPQEQQPPLSETEVKEMLIRLNQHVRENFEHVGPRFAEEARAIFHHKAEERPIYGSTTPEEREQLDEESIPYGILPKPKLDS
jgi:hypothetical protein